jgi:hypothetical protein
MFGSFFGGSNINPMLREPFGPGGRAVNGFGGFGGLGGLGGIFAGHGVSGIGTGFHQTMHGINFGGAQIFQTVGIATGILGGLGGLFGTGASTAAQISTVGTAYTGIKGAIEGFFGGSPARVPSPGQVPQFAPHSPTGHGQQGPGATPAPPANAPGAPGTRPGTPPANTPNTPALGYDGQPMPTGLGRNDLAVTELQQRLKAAGYDDLLGNTGANRDGVDQKFGEKTRAAYNQAARDAGMSPAEIAKIDFSKPDNPELRKLNEHLAQQARDLTAERTTVTEPLRQRIDQFNSTVSEENQKIRLNQDGTIVLPRSGPGVDALREFDTSRDGKIGVREMAGKGQEILGALERPITPPRSNPTEPAPQR